jgi:hypothetical protein
MVTLDLDVVEGGDVLGALVEQDGLDPRTLGSDDQNVLALQRHVLINVATGNEIILFCGNVLCCYYLLVKWM